MRAHGALVTALALLSPVGSTEAADLTIIGGDPLIEINPTTHTGSTRIQLRNTGEAARTVHLWADNFHSETSPRDLPVDTTFRLITEEKGGSTLALDLKPQTTVQVDLNLSNFLEAGEAQAALMNDDVQLATIRASKINVPFDVSLQDADSEILLRYERSAHLSLFNADDMTYSFDWRVWDAESGRVLGEKTGDLIGPKSSLPLKFTPPKEIFQDAMTGILRDEERPGKIELRFTPAGKIRAHAPTTRMLPVTLQLRRYDATLQEIGSYVLILILLVLGALASLFLNLWVPNQQRVRNILERIQTVLRSLRSVSNKIESSLRVALRVERLRITQTVQSLSMWDADAATKLSGARSELESLERKVDILRSLDVVVGRLQSLGSKTSGAPAIVLDEVQNLVNQVTDLLKLSTADVPEFDKASQLVKSAGAKLDHIAKENAEVAKALAEAIGNLQKAKDADGHSIWEGERARELLEKLPGLKDALKRTDLAAEDKIKPYHYHWLSSCVERLTVLRHYAAGPRDGGRAEPELTAEKEQFEELLINNLRVRNWIALLHARRIREAFDQNVYPTDIQKAIEGEQFTIRTVPEWPEPNQPIRLEVHLRDPGMATSAAREFLRCEWTFPGIGKEEGWEISHYFRSEKDATFQIRFEAAGKSFEPVVCTVELQQEDSAWRRMIGLRLTKRGRMEAVKLFIAVGVAILAMLAGARDQLLKLDLVPGLVAVFLLGFGADTIKNLVTRTQSRPDTSE